MTGIGYLQNLQCHGNRVQPAKHLYHWPFLERDTHIEGERTSPRASPLLQWLPQRNGDGAQPPDTSHSHPLQINHAEAFFAT